MLLILLALGAPVPELSVPHCSDGVAEATPYLLTVPKQDEYPTEPTMTSVCWEGAGVVVRSNSTDNDIWQTCEECNCAVFSNGDVAEAFLGPVSSPSAAPTWYLELDVGALHGASWAGIVKNSLGTDTLYTPAIPCQVDPPAGSFASCELGCGGPRPVVRTAEGPGWWWREMVVPWELYAEKFRPVDGKPWPTWRGNFYRYAYPNKLPDGSFDHSAPELSGWSSTHNPSFHIPDRFGVLTFQPTRSSVV